MNPFTVVDLFCGAGGSSTGAMLALRELGIANPRLYAFNHWERAVETHRANHPNAISEKVDLYEEDPLRWFKRGELDLLIASPTCVYYSRARGGRPVSFDQRKGRMTPTQVYRWAKELRPKRIIVENVPEFEAWGPVARDTGKPRPERRGTNFRRWVARLRRLGYRIEWRVLNAANFGDATTRSRFFLIGVFGQGEIRWPEPTHAKTGPWGTRLARWRAAREVIDWSRRGASIFSRKKPLAAKTLLRIYAGIVRFAWPLAFRVRLARYMRSLGIKVPEVREQRELFEPGVLVMRQHADMRSIRAPLPTVTASGTHFGIIEPFVFPANQGKERERGIRSTEEPLSTVVTKDFHALVEPFVLSQGAGGAPRPSSEPVPTIPTEGAHALIAPFYGASGCSSPDEPLATVTTRDRFGLVMPVTHADERRARSTDEPIPTVTSARELAFITAAFGERETQAARVRSVDEPAPTLCARGRVPLVQGVTLEELDQVDILFRMLEPDELAAAMGFPASYRFSGNKTERTRQIGNAVAVNTARALVAALLGSEVG